MTEIEEIPIKQDEPSEDIQDIAATHKKAKEEIEESPQETKKRGRPPGAKNKPKTTPEAKKKPKAKAEVKTKAKKRPEPEEYESSEESDAPPPPPRLKRARAPPAYDPHAVAAEVLGLLQQQRYHAQSARRAHYASWFQ